MKTRKKELELKSNFSKGINLLCRCLKCGWKIFDLPIILEIDKDI